MSIVVGRLAIQAAILTDVARSLASAEVRFDWSLSYIVRTTLSCRECYSNRSLNKFMLECNDMVRC